ncbi:MAG: Acetolactate synthase isozyme 3 large subunit [Alphaproteobacteria bacterium MarineAlpha11_Bin1]|nr:MAG: Acetolactate synthase isozyme 3 large subunit [Alphaproteobacteria bacterium MarineAlpha11_Bin1]|tara:strand:- start:1891 stop:3651 length:1761 start_codon:yes stop_codon:yes gene_type:complete
MAGKNVNGSEIIIQALLNEGVDTVFGYPGGAVLPIYDAIFQQNQLRHVLVRQEGGAVHMAEGYARSTGKVGVVLVTSGPGATNAVTGLTDALMDSIPIVCLTGQVPTHLIGNDAFQEADTTGITRPCTKHNYLVKRIEDLPKVMHEAFYVARSGRPGPVVVDLPKDILMELGQYENFSKVEHRTYRPKLSAGKKEIEKVVAMIAGAKKPLFYCGGGVINSGPKACKQLNRLIKMTGAPITLTLMGLGAYPGTDKQFLGMLGMHGTYEANLAMHEADLIIAVGARFDDRITGRLDAFAPNSKKIHIDIDPSSINKNVVVDLPVVGDVGNVLGQVLSTWKSKKLKVNAKAMKAWWNNINDWRKKDCLNYDQGNSVIKPQYAIERLYEHTKNLDCYITTEVGQHQMWAAQFYKFNEPNRWMTSGGLGTMGYGLPSAIGVQVAHPRSLVVDISGEASFLMNMQEMSTAVQYRAPVKVFVTNNQYMGMVRQWQELLHGGRYAESYTDALPDLVKLAEACQWTGLRAKKPDEVDDVIQEMIETDRPVIADIWVDQTENCFPMIPSGAAHNDMLLGPEDEATKPVSEEGMVLV